MMSSIVKMTETSNEIRDNNNSSDELAQLRYKLPALSMADGLLVYLFELADKDGSNSLSQIEIFELIEYLQLPYSRKDLTILFETFDVDKSGSLSFEEFQQFVYLLISRLLDTLIQGEVFYKYDRFGRKHSTFIRLDESCRFITWKNLSKCFYQKNLEHTLDIHHCSPRLVSGQVTFKFSRRLSCTCMSRKDNSIKKKSFSIIYFRGNKERSLDLVCPSKEIHSVWCSAINILFKGVSVNMANISVALRYLRYMFDTADTDHSGQLSRDEVYELVRRMGIRISSKELSIAFASVDIDQSGELNRQEFSEFVQLMSRRAEIVPLWDALINGHNELINNVEPLNLDNISFKADEVVTMDSLNHFWRTVQGGELCEEAKSIDFNKVFPSGVICLTDFVILLSSVDNFIVDSGTPPQDMSQPLSHYFIHSSHNTYLEGDQFTSSASVKRYIDDLMNGVRSIEIDTWDGSDGEPEVTHGYTLTSAILFKDVINAIHKYAFVTSPYPIIISLENHCSEEQQRRMVMILKEIFKDALLLPHGSFISSDIKLPSPLELKGKILIKGVRISNQAQDCVIEGDQDEEAAEDEEYQDTEDDSNDQKETGRKSILAKMRSSFDSYSGKIITDPMLSGVAYLSKAKLLKFDSSIFCDLISSFKERSVTNAIADQVKICSWIEYNKSHLCRVYPSPLRVDSSNYNPLKAWSVGAQLVALNTQTTGVPLMLNNGMFRLNRNAGYVLKPHHLLGGLSMNKPMTLSINLISGQNLPKLDDIAILSPKIEISLHDVEDGRNIKNQVLFSSTAKHNGFNPVWNEVFEFDIECFSLAQLSFRCFNESDTGICIATASYPVHLLRQGFRMVQLFDLFGRTHSVFSFATLFVHLKVQQKHFIKEDNSTDVIGAIHDITDRDHESDFVSLKQTKSSLEIERDADEACLLR